MGASVFSSAHLARLFDPGETGKLFSDSAEIRSLLLVEGALAKVQGAAGIIPETSAKAIHRASLEVHLDPAALAAATGENGVVVPALVAAFRAELPGPEHAQYVHWGATSQDILDTGLMLRLRRALALAKEDLQTLLKAMGAQADRHAETVMSARTWAQQATPTTWGAVLAQWGLPLADTLDRLPALQNSALTVSLSGAAGTASQLGPDPNATRHALAEALGLVDPGRSWHTDRTPVLQIANWFSDVSATLAAMGQTLVALTSSEIAEVALTAAGQSSTMPQKQNPVGPSLLVALNGYVAASRAQMQHAAAQAHQRDGTAWMQEWNALPQIVLSTATALRTANKLVPTLQPRPDQMSAPLASGPGLVFAERLSFALADRMSRPAAQAAVKALSVEAATSGRSLADLARAAYPDLPSDLFEPLAATGNAVRDARNFARRVEQLA